MKIKTIILTGILAVVGSSLLAPCARAAAVSYTNGDLLLGFRAATTDPDVPPTGANSSYLLNLGNAAQYASLAPGSTINVTTSRGLGNIALDLNSTFGSGWTTSPDVRWGVFGTTHNVAVGSDPAWTLYAGKATVGLVSQTAYARGSINNQGSAAALIQSVGTAYGNGNYVSTANSNFGVIQNSAEINTYGEFHAGVSFGRFSGAEGSFASGTAGTTLDLYRLDPAPAGGAIGSAGTLLGQFSINNSGTITFTAVPEPSTTALLVVALLSILLIVRRRTQSRAQA